MKIKVCGMRDSENIVELVKLAPDYIGFIFYDKSKRMVVDFPRVSVPSSIKKVGVFVNESIENVLKIVKENKLDAVQLHGDESADYCEEIRRHPELVSGSHYGEILKQVQHDKSFVIIKAFSVDEHFDFSTTKDYEAVCDLFLFDTKGNNYGGNGVKYDWKILENYEGNTPFLLSGGIGEGDALEVLNFYHKKCVGVDLNSGFEIVPGLKSIEKLKLFKERINA